MKRCLCLLALLVPPLCVGCDDCRDCRGGRCVREEQPVRYLIDQPPVDTPIGESL